MDSRDEPSLSRATRLGSRPLRGWGARHHARGPTQFGAKIAGFAIAVAIAIPNEDYGEGGVVLYSRRPTGAWTVAAHLIGDVSTLGDHGREP